MKALASAVSSRISRIRSYDFFVLYCRISVLIGMTGGAIISAGSIITAIVTLFYPWVPVLWEPVNEVTWRYRWVGKMLFTADNIMTYPPTLFFWLGTVLFFAVIALLFRSCIRDLDRFLQRHAN